MDLNYMIKLCKMNSKMLQKNLINFLKFHGYNVVYKEDNYIFAEGDLPICLIAHMDTVFNHHPSEFLYDKKKKVLWSPGGSGFDDRTGVYLILKLIIEKKFKPSIIFTDLEERGGIGAYQLVTDFKNCPFKDCRALIELDRSGFDDCVFYNCDNQEFEKFINSFGFRTDIGSFSDISIIAPEWKIAAVNLSVGYLDEHTGNERLYCKWTDATFKKVSNLLSKSFDMKFYKYVSYVVPNIFDPNVCLLCSKPVGDIYYKDTVSNYKLCESCYQKYYTEIPFR